MSRIKMTPTLLFCQLRPSRISIFPLGKDCYFVTGSYDIIYDMECSIGLTGKGEFQSWIQSNGEGLGIMVFSLKTSILYFQLWVKLNDSLKDIHILRLGLIGGSFQKQSLYFGNVIPIHQGHDIQLRIQMHFYQEKSSSNVPFYLSLLNTDRNVYTNEIEKGNPNSVYRVGELVVRDPASNQMIGRAFFQDYASSQSNIGIGMSILTTQNQIFYEFTQVLYDTNIKDINSSAEITTIVSSGQNMANMFQQGKSQTTLSEDKQKYLDTLSGFLRTIPSRQQKKIDCVLTDLSISIFSLQPDEPKAVVRLGTYILRLRESRQIIGKVIFQAYVETKKSSIGTTILFLDNIQGIIFGTFYAQLENPQVVEPDSAQVGFNAGAGSLENLYWGYTTLTNIPNSKDRNAVLYYALSCH